MMMPVKPPLPSQSIGCASEMMPSFARKQVHDTETREDVLDAQRADEGWQNQRCQQRGPQPFASGKLVAGEENRQRDRSERGENRRQHGDLATVDERHPVQLIFEQQLKEAQRERDVPLRVREQKRPAQQSRQRIDEKAPEEEGEKRQGEVFHEGIPLPPHAKSDSIL